MDIRQMLTYTKDRLDLLTSAHSEKIDDYDQIIQERRG